MLRILIAALLGGAVLFLWGQVSWMMLPWRDAVMLELPSEQVLIDALEQAPQDEAFYISPMWPADFSDDEAMERFKQRHAAGPLISVTYHRAGDTSMTDNLIIGYALNVAMALVASVLLVVAVRGHCNFLERWLFVGALGLFVGLAADAIAWNWMYTPTRFMLINIADHVIGALAMGLILALLIRPKRAEPQGEPAELAP